MKKLVSRVTSDAGSPPELFSVAVSFVVCIITAVQAFIKLYDYNTVLANYSLIIIPLTFLVSFIYGKLMYKLGGRLVHTGELTIGDLTAFYMITGIVGLQLMQFFMNVGSVSGIFGSMQKINSISDAAPERESGAPVPELCSDITFDNVSFAYNEDREVLKDISLNIPMGKVTAIIGGTVRENMTYGLDREVSEAEGSPAELEHSNEYYRLFKKTL